MKLQTRFFLLILVVFAIVLGLVFVQRYFDLQRIGTILDSSLNERKESFATSIDAEGELFKTLVRDYSFWDEMVDFVNTKNPEFAANNLDTGLDTYNANAIWIYSTSGKLIYSTTSEENPVNALTLPPEIFTTLNSEKFVHYYTETPEGVVEVRAATIVPGDDPEHTKPAKGYMIIARLLSDEYLEKLSSLTRTTVDFVPADYTIDNAFQDNKVSFTFPLKDLDGNVVQQLKSNYEVVVVKDLLTSYNRQLVIISIAGLLILTLIFIGVWLFVLRPIRLISASLTRKDSAMLDKLSKSKSEFGELARVVQEFYRQKLTIEEAKVRQAELEKLNKEKAAFLSVAAHELKAPGTIISLLSESIERNAAKTKASKSLSSDIDAIAHQAKKMTTLVSDLRSAAEGKDMVEREPTVFEFDKFLASEVNELGYVIDQKIVLSGKTNQTIRTDETHLGQVVSNLIRNAAKYSSPDTTIKVNSSVKNGSIIVEFVDQGVGISKEDQKHLFEKYYRASNVKDKVEGLGLGLSICAEIIEKVGGKIWVESELGKGSHFFISLPINKLSPKSDETNPKKDNFSPQA